MHFAGCAESLGSHFSELGMCVWTTKPFSNWKKAVEKMKAHEKSDTHSQAKDAALAMAETLREGSVVQQLQRAGKQEMMKN